VPPRLHCDTPLHASAGFALPEAAARHAQVLRLQPGDAVTLFDGRGGEWSARVAAMGRREVMVDVLAHDAVERELPFAVTLALAMPAGERMDFVVEKATELGAAALQPLVAERSVLRLAGERAAKRVAHWQAIAVAACEQCGRNRVPIVQPVRPLRDWLAGLDSNPTERRWLLGWTDAQPFAAMRGAAPSATLVLSGPEGGFSADEEGVAAVRGFRTVTLGERVLRADTAPLAALAALALQGAPGLSAATAG
jgi:16S rRNA (uracil1498-N3)-methyltransferase